MSTVERGDLSQILRVTHVISNYICYICYLLLYLLYLLLVVVFVIFVTFVRWRGRTCRGY